MLKRPFRSTQVLALTLLLLAPFTKSLASTTGMSPQQESQRAVEAGNQLMGQGQYDQAEHSFRIALERDPSSFEAVLGLARALTETAEYAQAENLCQRSMRMAKDDPIRQSRVHQGLGEIYSREGKSPAAMSAYYKAAELRPNDVDVTRGLANCAIRAGLYAEAAVAYTKLLRLQPLDLSAKKELAWVDFKLERYPLAISNYEAIRDSLGTVDRYYLAQAYAKSNDVDRAVEQFREVVRLDKDNYKGVYCNMANAYYEANRYESAILIAHEGLQADSSSACLHFCWAQALDKLGRHKDAIPVFEAALEDPTYADAAKKELERQRRIVRLLQSK
jgi:tetratricopeptide (TPR) repeat protein